MKRIAVFCGSSAGTNPIFREIATQLGKSLASKSIGVVYGGANVGLMGAVADGALDGGGEVIGVLPGFLRPKELAHRGLSRLIMVESMHERKMTMNELCDAVIALPGGFGTFEELFEMLTWEQLGLHDKPIGILNIDGFYQPLLSQLDQMIAEGFLKQENRDMLLVDQSIEGLLKKMEHYKPPLVRKWIDKKST